MSRNLIPVVRALRNLLAAHDAAEFALGASFEGLDAELELQAPAVRTSLSQSTQLVFEFLDRLEKNPTYVGQRTEYLRAQERTRRKT